MTNRLGACACRAAVELCDDCRATAIRVAVAAAAACDHTKACAVNEIDHEDPHSGRVVRLRRDADGQWQVTDVRQMGSIERARCRPATSSA